MCDPFSLLGLAAGVASSVGGTLIANSEASANAKRAAQNAANIADARNKELDESRARLKKLSDQNNDTFQQTLGTFSPEQQQQQQQTAQDTATQQFDKSVTPADASYQVQGSAPAIVQNTYDKVTQDATNRGLANASRLGALDAYKGNLLGNTFALKAAGRDVDMRNGFAQQEASLLPSYQDFAGNAVAAPNGGVKPSSGLGDLLAGAGKLAAGAAGAGYFTPKK